MYTLRTILSDNREHNEYLGNEYSFITKEKSPDEFDVLSAEAFGTNPVDKKPYNKACEAYVVTHGARKIIPIRKKTKYFIVTDTGKTFANLTIK